MLVKLLNDIMYKEENTKDTFLYKWAKENGYEYGPVWRVTQKLQDCLYHLQNGKTSLIGLKLYLLEEKFEEKSLKTIPIGIEMD